MKGPLRIAFATVSIAAVLLLGCRGEAVQRDEPEPQSSSPATAVQASPAELTAADVPAGARPCFLCHREVVETYLGHGMARSVGPVGEPRPGSVTHPDGRLYTLYNDGGGAWLEAGFPDGGLRRQRLVGRIGAGIFDTSWAAMEVDVVTGAETGRLFFAPVETIAGHGHELSPFELASPSPGIDMALNEGCLSCHTTGRLQELPGTAGAVQGCHECSHPPELAVEEVTGEPGRTPDACVDCHVRRSQPFDLPHVRSADHFVRRRIPPPAEVPYRQFADREGELEVFDDGRIAPLLASVEGRRWRSGVLAIGLMTMGRFDDAAGLFAGFPTPGSPAAVEPSAPPPLVALETEPTFHQLRAMALMATRRVPEAFAAYGDALKLDPLSAGALMGRARLSWLTGDVPGALNDTQAVIEAYPAEHPWNLRVEMAERLNQPHLAAVGLQASLEAWPSNPLAWNKLAWLLGRQGDTAGERRALARVGALRPSLRTGAPTARPGRDGHPLQSKTLGGS